MRRRVAPGAPGSSLFDRDFGEADYELLLQLDAVDAPERKRLKQINKKLIDNLPTRRMSKAEVGGEKEPKKKSCVETKKRALAPTSSSWSPSHLAKNHLSPPPPLPR